MDENVDNHVSTHECLGNEINWVCKICQDLPNYAGMYLWMRENEKNKTYSEDEKNADLIQMKYYYALLHLLDDIHKLPECPDSERPTLQSADQKCPAPEYFNYYRKIYNTYANILMSEKGLEKINLKCDICAVLSYALFTDLDMVAKNMHSDDMEKMQKLELDAIVTDYYFRAFGPCNQKECPNIMNWLDLIRSYDILTNYLETKDRNALHISLSDWNKIRAADNLLNTEFKTSSRDFQTKDIPLNMLEGKKLVYLDFGVYQLYEDNEIFRTGLDTYAEMDDLQFVYSPTHMEEVCRMGDSVFESRRRENISQICSDCEILPVGNGCLKILEEPIDTCFSRAKKYEVLNRIAEELECASFESMEEQTCRLFGCDEKEMEKRRKTISGLTSIQLFDPENETIDNKSLNRIFYEICGAQVLVEKFKDYSKTERTFFEIREAVRLIYMLMNALGYHRNKIEKRTNFTHKAFYPTYDRKFYRTIRSGFYDVDHLCYASKCDYFVTCDFALSLQAIEIYRYLGCKTHVVYCDKSAINPFLPMEILSGNFDTM